MSIPNRTLAWPCTSQINVQVSGDKKLAGRKNIFHKYVSTLNFFLHTVLVEKQAKRRKYTPLYVLATGITFDGKPVRWLSAQKVGEAHST